MDRPLGKDQLIKELIRITGLTRKQAKEFIEALPVIAAQQISHEGPGEFVIPELIRIKRIDKPAKKDFLNNLINQRVDVPPKSVVRTKLLGKIEHVSRMPNSMKIHRSKVAKRLKLEIDGEHLLNLLQNFEWKNCENLGLMKILENEKIHIPDWKKLVKHLKSVYNSQP